MNYFLIPISLRILRLVLMTTSLLVVSVPSLALLGVTVCIKTSTNVQIELTFSHKACYNSAFYVYFKVSENRYIIRFIML